mmetsp:Transcript_73400/g.164333  ORF Transcript_73400/g.164333 Transcript_73400/m.164333 type:complete len:271 (+) Transcript_73400:134-946(+)
MAAQLHSDCAAKHNPRARKGANTTGSRGGADAKRLHHHAVLKGAQGCQRQGTSSAAQLYTGCATGWYSEAGPSAPAQGRNASGEMTARMRRTLDARFVRDGLRRDRCVVPLRRRGRRCPRRARHVRPQASAAPYPKMPFLPPSETTAVVSVSPKLFGSAPKKKALFSPRAAPVRSIMASFTATSLMASESAALLWPSARTRSASASPRALSTSASAMPRASILAAAALPLATVSNFWASAAATAPCARDFISSLSAGTAATTLIERMVTP